jgi:hypothetical protein
MTQSLAPGAAIQMVGTTPTAAGSGASYAPVSGTITTATSTVTTPSPGIGLAGNVTIYMFGTYAGVNAVFEISPDNTNWFPVSATREDTAMSETSTGVLAANTSRAWTTGAPGFSFFRVRATAWTSGTANVVIVAGTYPFEPLVSATIRKRPTSMYSAVYRLANATAAARPLSTGALTANTNKQIATIYHTAASTRRVQVKYVAVTLHSVGAVAGTIEFEIVTLSATTAPATGAPTITPAKNDQADAAAEAACLALPGTQGSVVNADQPLGDPYIASQGISGAGSTASPPPSPSKAVLWDSRDAGDGKDLIMRAGTAEGYAVIVRSNAASTVLAIATIFFTEE